MVRAAKQLHNEMLRNVFLSTMAFFDTTPLGRIVNRFSKVFFVVFNGI
jgi:ATP-binding cassette subfamily C (CFTR/MRP) protein 1